MKLRLCAALTKTRLWLAFTIDIKLDWPGGGKFLWNRYDKAAFWSSHRSLLKGPLSLLFILSDGHSYLNTFSCRGLKLRPGARAALSSGKVREWDHGFTANPVTSGMGGSEFPALNTPNFKRIHVWHCVLQPETIFSSFHELELLQDSGGKNFSSLRLHRQGRALREEKDYFPEELEAKSLCRAICNAMNTLFCLHSATHDHQLCLDKFSTACAANSIIKGHL